MESKLKIPKVSNSSTARSAAITPQPEEDPKESKDGTRIAEPEAPILTEQDHADLKRARENPKLISMVRHIDTLVEKTQKVRGELSGMIQTSIELKDQCKLQEQELTMLDQEQKKVAEEMIELRTKVEQLTTEKGALEKKLEELKLENDELEAFLAQNKRFTAQEEVH
jgi:chromosome segregation ATPase